MEAYIYICIIGENQSKSLPTYLACLHNVGVFVL